MSAKDRLDLWVGNHAESCSEGDESNIEWARRNFNGSILSALHSLRQDRLAERFGSRVELSSESRKYLQSRHDGIDGALLALREYEFYAPPAERLRQLETILTEDAPFEDRIGTALTVIRDSIKLSGERMAATRDRQTGVKPAPEDPEPKPVVVNWEQWYLAQSVMGVGDRGEITGVVHVGEEIYAVRGCYGPKREALEVFRLEMPKYGKRYFNDKLNRFHDTASVRVGMRLWDDGAYQDYLIAEECLIFVRPPESELKDEGTPAWWSARKKVGDAQKDA